MADLQITYLQDIMPVTKVEPLPSATIPAVRIYGRNLLAAASVLINGIESPSFIVVSKGQLVAEIPTSLVGDLIRSVAVLSNRIVTTERSVVTFRLGGHSSKIRGILRLVQRYVLMLLTTPGSDIHNTEMGGGILRLIGKSINGNENIQASVQQSVAKAATDLKRIQSTSQGLSSDETLVSATIANVFFDQRTTTLAIKVQVVSAAGDAAIANLFV